MHFEWDPKKRQSNLAKHQIDFVDAVRIFDGFVHQRQDARKEYGELRTIAIGSMDDQILTVVWTLREGAIRIVSARRANHDEAREYRQVRPEET
jgi:uncharacterized DUF497 family protein